MPSGPDSKSRPHSDGLNACFMPIVPASPEAPAPARASYNKSNPSPRPGTRASPAALRRATVAADEQARLWPPGTDRCLDGCTACPGPLTSRHGGLVSREGNPAQSDSAHPTAGAQALGGQGLVWARCWGQDAPRPPPALLAPPPSPALGWGSQEAAGASGPAGRARLSQHPLASASCQGGPHDHAITGTPARVGVGTRKGKPESACDSRGKETPSPLSCHNQVGSCWPG